METDEDLYHAAPQAKGKAAHATVDKKRTSNRKSEIQSLPVYSEELGIMGKIDIYRQDEKLLIERKYQLKQIFRGQIYQLWAQYFCMTEMGYIVDKLAFYEISTNKTFPIDVPGDSEKSELIAFIERFINYYPSDTIIENPNKCAHCIYCNLCDKTTTENVYS